MSINIKSKREGFRRCGIPHSASEIAYPDDRFTPDEIAILQAEPMLTVERIVPDEPDQIPIDMTVAQIKAALDDLEIEYPDKAKKAELFAILEVAKAEEY